MTIDNGEPLFAGVIVDDVDEVVLGVVDDDDVDGGVEGLTMPTRLGAN
jgi:hypothetical protein